MLIIVQELMHRTFVEMHGRAPRRSEIPKPADHFDLIVGTGTGGLIAIMLGRLRLDLETCKELYVRMTRMVFETDKTIAGIPYRSTLFKASRLEEAIRSAVRDHTVYEREGRDIEEPDFDSESLSPSESRPASSMRPRRHSSNASTLSFSARSPTAQMAPARPVYNSRYGNPEARLYDGRESRTKTAVTAMYKSSPRGSPAVMLRSYDSRREPPPEFDCKIWQAGRATCAIGLAFKPISIGQTSFHDDGAGTFNPAPEALDEAVINEWPGREVGVFISVGTGKRPRGSDSNQQSWYEGFMGEYAEARRRLIAKIEGCERIHEHMLRNHLAKRNVNPDNYYRLNVEIGVGEFGMNEWNRLGDISTSTRRYMSREEEQHMLQGMSSKLARVFKLRQRYDRASRGIPELVKTNSQGTYDIPEPMAFELPAEIPSHSPSPLSPGSRASNESGRPDSFTMGNETFSTISPSPHSSYYDQRSSAGQHNPLHPPPPMKSSSPPPKSVKRLSVVHHRNPSLNGGSPDDDRLTAMAPTPSQYRTVSGSSDRMSRDEMGRPMSSSQPGAPPLPPKMPLQSEGPGSAPKMLPLRGPPRSAVIPQGEFPPYPIDEEEPPPVNMSRKPEYRG